MSKPRSVDVRKIPRHCCPKNCCCRKLPACEAVTEAYKEEKQKLLDRGVHPDLVTAMARSKVEARPFA